PSLIQQSGTGGVVNNSGTFRKSVGDGQTTLSLTFNNVDGTIDVQIGTLLNNVELTMDRGTYIIADGSVMRSSALTNLVGIIESEPEGTLELAGSIVVADGTSPVINFSGTGLTIGGIANVTGGGILINENILNITGTSGKGIIGGTTVQNEGTMNWLGAGTVTLNDGTINNSGLIDLQVGSLIQRSGTGGAISNSGTFRKSIGDGQTKLSLPFNNVDGTIEVQAGTLLNNVELTLDRGTYVIADGLALRSSALTNLVGNIESAPEGTLELTGSIVIAEGTSPTVNFSGDGLTVGGIANVTGGGVLINENILNITGASGKNISGGTTVQNEGTMNWLGNGTVTLNDGTINNSGLIDFQVSSLIQRSGAGGVIENTGILRKSQGATTSTISLPLKNQNGTIEVSEGTLTLNVELEMEEGTYSIAAGAILESTFLTRLIGNITSELEGTFNLSGNIQVDDGTLSALNFSGSGVNITGTSNIRGGGTLVNQDLLNFIGSAGKGIIEGTSIDNQGTLNWIGNGTVTLNDGVINNDGLIDLQASSLIQQTGVGGAINNKGTIVKSVDNVTSFSLPLINDSGTINLPTGTLAFNNSFDNGLEGRVQGMGTIDLPPTLLYTNQGIFAPGASPGTLNVSGAFEMEDEATIELELNGLTPDVEHDVLSISGNAFLTGNLDISVGFNPQVGDEFTVVNAGGSIDNCLFPATVTSNITTNFRYIFEVVCGTTSLTLRLTEIIELFPPVAENDTLTVENGGTATLNVTENDTDADGILDLSTFMLIDSTQHGYLTYDGMGSVTYTHNGSATNNDFFTYTITDNDGLASNIGRVEITILSDETPFEFEVEIFNAISPNGDNLNDYMQIENSDLLPNNRLIVFNRWGDRVFEISGYNNADRIFIGRSNLGSGGILPSGTYYYTFDPGDGRKEFTGFLTLKN
ncbi:MAG: gliding motility-associated C-terminal domain-containing protein, partial [Bacteroidota bacterium]